jgi:thiamine biosynthesis protein ThiI
MPEYCGMISVNPTTEARLDKVIKEFEKIDINIINEAFETRITSDMRDIFDEEKQVSSIEKVSEVSDEIVIDIREEDKRVKNPLKLEKVEILNIPFYDINSRFTKLDQKRNYLFYCDK